MKKLSIIHFLGLALLAMTFNACVEDPIDPGSGPIGGTNEPGISLADVAGYVAFDSEITPGEIFNVRVEATRGDDSPLKVLYVKEDGLDLPANRLIVNGADAASNPILLFSPDVEGFTWDISILGHEVGTVEYAFIVEDDAGETATTRLNITAGQAVAPTVFIGGSGMPNTDAGTFIGIPVTVGQGTFALSSISVYENDELITDLSRLGYGDINNPFDGNPYILPTADQNGFETQIWIRSSEEGGITNNYRIDVADELGNVNSVGGDFTIITNQSGTSVTTLQGVLFNRAGPAGTGGLDLDTGEGTGSSDAAAEIRDEGIDSSVGNDINWIKRISGVNGSDLKLLVPTFGGVGELFDFDNIQFTEQIADMAGQGTDFVDLNADGNLISYLIEIGDTFYVRGTDKNYMIIVREINETPDNNNDNYVLDIKY